MGTRRQGGGNAKDNIEQHTEGRGETSRAMLDLSMSGLTHMVDTIGGWLGVDGSVHAGESPAGVREHNVCRLHSQRTAKFERSGADKDASGNEDDFA